jgi:hypothetical protein
VKYGYINLDVIGCFPTEPDGCVAVYGRPSAELSGCPDLLLIPVGYGRWRYARVTSYREETRDLAWITIVVHDDLPSEVWCQPEQNWVVRTSLTTMAPH